MAALVKTHGGTRKGAGRKPKKRATESRILAMSAAVRWKVLDQEGVDPARELAKVVKGQSEYVDNDQVKAEDKIGILKELLNYFSPKLKALDLLADGEKKDGGITVNVVNFSGREEKPVIEVQRENVDDLPSC